MKKSMNHFISTLDLSPGEMNILDKQKVARLLIDEIIVGDEIKVNHCIPLALDFSLKSSRSPLQLAGGDM